MGWLQIQNQPEPGVEFMALTRGKGSDFFQEKIFVERNYLGYVGHGILRKTREIRFEKNVSRGVGQSDVRRESDGQNRMNLAAIE